MAAAMVGEGTGYADLTYTIGLNSEEYGVGFRKGSDLAAALNDFFAESYGDGSMIEIAEKYGNLKLYCTNGNFRSIIINVIENKRERLAG